MIKVTGSEKVMPLKWMFHKGGMDDTDDDLTNTFSLSSVVGTIVTNNPELQLTGLKLETSSNFLFSLSCDLNKFNVTFNNKWSQTIEYDSTMLDDFTDLTITGAVSVYKALYGGKV